jgi:hypothetical protein
MKLIRNLILSALVLFGFAAMAAVPVASVHADPKATVCASIGGCASNPNAGTSVNKIIKLVVNVLSILVGVTAVVMIIVSGFRFMTSGGDAGSVAKARGTMTYAVIGLVVAISAQAITHFVFQKLK